MSKVNRGTQWLPAELAVLQNGDGTPSYYRPREADESYEDFIERIAGVVVRGVTSYPYTAFVEVVEGATGKTDEATTILITQAMKRQKLARQEQFEPRPLLYTKA